MLINNGEGGYSKLEQPLGEVVAALRVHQVARSALPLHWAVSAGHLGEYYFIGELHVAGSVDGIGP